MGHAYIYLPKFLSGSSISWRSVPLHESSRWEIRNAFTSETYHRYWWSISKWQHSQCNSFNIWVQCLQNPKLRQVVLLGTSLLQFDLCFWFWNLFFFFRLGFHGSCIEGRSRLVVQQEGPFCSNFVHLCGQVGNDFSQLPTRGDCRWWGSRVQVCFVDEEKSRNREWSGAKARTIVKSDSYDLDHRR